MTRVYLVRHGRTALNASGALRGRLDPSLDDVGRREAAELARLILGLHDAIGPVVSSPLRRAFETAWPIGEGAQRSIDRDPDLNGGLRA